MTSYNYGLPKISVGSFSVIGATACVPRQRVDTNWHFIDNYSWQIGRHDFKFGYEFRRTTHQHHPKQQFPRQAELQWRRSNSPQRFLEGIPSGGSQASGYTNRHEARKQQGPVRAGQLPLDQSPDRELSGCAGITSACPARRTTCSTSSLQPDGGTLVQVGGQGGPSSLYNKDYNNFAPRFAVCLRPQRQW